MTDIWRARLHADADSDRQVFIPIDAGRDALDVFPSEAASRPRLAAAAFDFAEEPLIVHHQHDSYEPARTPAVLVGRGAIYVLTIVLALGLAVGVPLWRQRSAEPVALETKAPDLSSMAMSASAPLPGALVPARVEPTKVQNSGLKAAPPVVAPRTPPVAPQRRSAQSDGSSLGTTVSFLPMTTAPAKLEAASQPAVAATPAPAPAAVATVAALPAALPSALPSAPPPMTPSVARPEPPPAAISAPRAERVDEEAGIRAALGKYRDAYERLDAAAAKRIWSAVDERALSKAFAGLESQSLTFDDCRTSVNAASAVASCRGTVTYIGRLGSRNSQTQNREWTFKLQKEGDGWAVQNVQVR